MTSGGRSFNEVTYYGNKMEGVRRYGQAKALAKRAKTWVTFKVLTPRVQGGQH